MAVGQAIVVITRNVDLSVGSIMGLSAFATGALFVSLPDMPIVGALVLGTVLGIVCGVINGTLIAVARVPALVVTLGTLYVFRGIDYSWATGRPGQRGGHAGVVPADGQRREVLGVPYLALFAVVVVIVAGYFMRSFRSGREQPSGPTRTRPASGIPTGRRVFAAFVTSGALAGLAGGALRGPLRGALDATVGLSSELNVVAAVVVGVAIFGGSGSVYGATLGDPALDDREGPAVARHQPIRGGHALVGALAAAAIGLDPLPAGPGRRASEGERSRV